MSTDIIQQIMFNAQAGESAFALAGTFANSQLVPKHLQGKPADCFIALTMAAELRQNPITVMQNIVIVSGTAGWKASYMIAMANASGRFTDVIDWEVERRPKKLAYTRKTRDGNKAAEMEDMTVTAFATLKSTGRRVSFSVTTRMAIDEGWANNEKYLSMAEVMLRYRSGAFLVRFYAPDVMLGFQTAEELETIPATVEVVQTSGAKDTVRKFLTQNLEAPVEEEPTDADPVEQAPDQDEQAEIARQEAEQARRDAEVRNAQQSTGEEV